MRAIWWGAVRGDDSGPAEGAFVGFVGSRWRYSTSGRAGFARDFWGDLGVDSIWVDSATLKAFLVSFLAHSGSTGVPAIEPTEVPLRRYSSRSEERRVGKECRS